MELFIREVRIDFKEDVFTINAMHYRCKDTGHLYSDDTLDELMLYQVHLLYCEKYNIPLEVIEAAIANQKSPMVPGKTSEYLDMEPHPNAPMQSGLP